MADKKQVIERLSALKPVPPTNTRVQTEPPVSETQHVQPLPPAKIHSAEDAKQADITVSVPVQPDSYVMTELKPGYISLIAENMNAMLKIREILLNEIGKINAVIIDTWKQSMIVSFDIFKTNSENIASIVNNAFTSSGKEKK